jgi:RimJ/RimL family protein N-acetyltransferase
MPHRRLRPRPSLDVVLKRLPDGTPIFIRPIRPDDKALLSSALARLSKQSVQQRFLSPKRRFTKAELRYLTEVDGWDHVALVAESAISFNRRLIGVVRYVRLPEDHEAAEVAFVVADDFHRRGVGTVLAEELARRAKMRGIKRFTATMASDNVAAHRLMEKLAGHLERHHVGSGVDELSGSLAA